MSVLLKTFKPGQPLFQEGDPSISLFIIKKGGVSIRKQDGDISFEVARAQPGEVLGELSFFDRLPRSASALALNDVEAIEIPFDALEKIYDSIPVYLKTIMASMADRLRQANEKIRLLEKKDKPKS